MPNSNNVRTKLWLERKLRRKQVFSKPDQLIWSRLVYIKYEIQAKIWVWSLQPYFIELVIAIEICILLNLKNIFEIAKIKATEKQEIIFFPKKSR